MELTKSITIGLVIVLVLVVVTLFALALYPLAILLTIIGIIYITHTIRTDLS